MKKICLNCGDEFFMTRSSQKFCCATCGRRYRGKHNLRGRTLKKSFAFFKQIVQQSKTFKEFDKLYREYFSDEGWRGV